MKRHLAFWLPNGLLLLLMAGSAVMYFTNSVQVGAVFTSFGYPVYTMYFNAVAKLLGAVAIVAPVPRALKEWAYAGYLYIMLLALQAVWMTAPGIPWMMFLFIALWAISYGWQAPRT
jgi:hypothetical protein